MTRNETKQWLETRQEPVPNHDYRPLKAALVILGPLGLLLVLFRRYPDDVAGSFLCWGIYLAFLLVLVLPWAGRRRQ
jgi:hypothetical protein